MAKYTYLVTVETDTEEHADQIIAERVGFDEEVVDDDGEEIEYRIYREVGDEINVVRHRDLWNGFGASEDVQGDR